MKKPNTAFLSQAAMIAAVYVVLTYVFAPFSFGEIQVRIAEALTILPLFTPAAVPGLFIGCLIGNILGGAILPDIVFGSIATLIGAFGTYLLRNQLPVLAAANPGKYSHRAVHTPLWLRRCPANPVLDAHNRHRGNPVLRGTGNHTIHRTKKI